MEDGWPLGLQPLNVRVGLVRNRDLNGSVSFNTLLTGSPSSSTDSSSDLDTESTGSFFHDKSITLGNLIGISSILELSRRSARRTTTSQTSGNKNNLKPKTWLFSICSKLTTDAVTINNTTTPSSLRHFLEAEKRAATTCRRNQSPHAYGPDDFSRVSPPSEANALFVNGHVVAPAGQSSSWSGLDGERRANTGLFEDGTNGYGTPLLLSCLCAHLTH
ncbi:hypothetical protein LguiB_035261 [Lonicera macranthoides]